MWYYFMRRDMHYNPFVGDSTVTGEFCQDAPAMPSFVMLVWTSFWANSRVVGDLESHNAHLTLL